MFWRQTGDADANSVGRSEPKQCSPSGCPHAWRCLRQEVPSEAPPVLCECAPCARSTQFCQLCQTHSWTFISTRARRRGDKIVSISEWGLWQINIQGHKWRNVLWEGVTQWDGKWVLNQKEIWESSRRNREMIWGLRRKLAAVNWVHKDSFTKRLFSSKVKIKKKKKLWKRRDLLEFFFLDKKKKAS